MFFTFSFFETFSWVLFCILQVLMLSLFFSQFSTHFLRCRNYCGSADFSLNVLKMLSANREKALLFPLHFLCWLTVPGQSKKYSKVISCKQECLGQILSAHTKCQIFTLFRRDASLHKFWKYSNVLFLLNFSGLEHWKPIWQTPSEQLITILKQFHSLSWIILQKT